jgi:Rho termination factor, N-terminal domain
MNDALMIGIVLTLVFGAVVFYLYNRLSMTERKMGLIEGVLTDLKIMMDAAPFSYESGSEKRGVSEFEPSPEYLNAISGPFPLKEEEVEDVQEDDYKNALEKEVKPSEVPYKSLQIDELAGVPLTANNAINVTKLSPDLESMSLKELQVFAKENGVTVTSGMRRKAIIDMLKSKDSVQETGSNIDGPELEGGSPL